VGVLVGVGVAVWVRVEVGVRVGVKVIVGVGVSLANKAATFCTSGFCGPFDEHAHSSPAPTRQIAAILHTTRRASFAFASLYLIPDR
jgi:hypothetical protein